MIFVQRSADITRGFVRERIFFQQVQHFGRTLEQARQEIGKPPAGRTAVQGAQRLEPHLPVEPRLVRRDKRRAAFQIARLPLEYIGQPVDTVVASLHDDFRARRRHDGEQPVGTDAAQWRDPPQQLQPGTGQIFHAEQSGRGFQTAHQDDHCGQQTHADRAERIPRTVPSHPVLLPRWGRRCPEGG